MRGGDGGRKGGRERMAEGRDGGREGEEGMDRGKG